MSEKFKITEINGVKILQPEEVNGLDGIILCKNEHQRAFEAIFTSRGALVLVCAECHDAIEITSQFSIKRQGT